MPEISELELRVLEAARKRGMERPPKTLEEKVFFVALARAYPEDLHYKEVCNCGEEDCDERLHPMTQRGPETLERE